MLHVHFKTRFSCFWKIKHTCLAPLDPYLFLPPSSSLHCPPPPSLHPPISQLLRASLCPSMWKWWSVSPSLNACTVGMIHYSTLGQAAQDRMNKRLPPLTPEVHTSSPPTPSVFISIPSISSHTFSTLPERQSLLTSLIIFMSLMVMSLYINSISLIKLNQFPCTERNLKLGESLLVVSRAVA